MRARKMWRCDELKSIGTQQVMSPALQSESAGVDPDTFGSIPIEQDLIRPPTVPPQPHRTGDVTSLLGAVSVKPAPSHTRFRTLLRVPTTTSSERVAMSHLGILRTYAQCADPSKHPPTLILAHSARTLTIFDAYPKSVIHLLVLPRVLPGSAHQSDVRALHSLRTLLEGDKTRARAVLDALREDGEKAAELLREEMRTRYGCVWDVWMGFHAVPSMQ